MSAKICTVPGFRDHQIYNGYLLGGITQDAAVGRTGGGIGNSHGAPSNAAGLSVVSGGRFKFRETFAGSFSNRMERLSKELNIPVLAQGKGGAGLFESGDQKCTY